MGGNRRWWWDEVVPRWGLVSGFNLEGSLTDLLASSFPQVDPCITNNNVQ